MTVSDTPKPTDHQHPPGVDSQNGPADSTDQDTPPVADVPEEDDPAIEETEQQPT